MELELALVRDVVKRALEEDLGAAGDVTTRACVPEGRLARGRVIARESGVIAGLPVAVECFRAVDEAVELSLSCHDGDRVEPDQVVMSAFGRAAALLAAERTALNLLQRLSGIATCTNAYVAEAPSGVRIFDTRKTTPGLRALEKYAVRVGGGCNHRFGLFDQVLIKENHFALAAPRSPEDVVRRAAASSTAPVIAEARVPSEALAAVRAGARVVMLDNFAPGPDLTRVVAAVRAEAERIGVEVEIEASGGVRLENIGAFAASGVDRLSVGALTHSVRALDLSMLMEAAP